MTVKAVRRFLLGSRTIEPGKTLALSRAYATRLISAGVDDIVDTRLGSQRGDCVIDVNDCHHTVGLNI